MRRKKKRKKKYRNESTNPKFIFRLTITDRGWFARDGGNGDWNTVWKCKLLQEDRGGEEDGEEETGEENGRCLFYEVAKTYDIPTKWFPFRVFDFLFHFFLAPVHSSLSSPSSNRLRF